jgi:hypothetical protein
MPTVSKEQKIGLYRNIFLHPNYANWRLAISEDDGIAYVTYLVNSSVDRFHPATEESVQICRMLAHEGLLESHATFNGMEYSIVSEEALKEIIHLQEHLAQIQKEKENE